MILARWPAPLRCKRRLAAGVGSLRAAAIQARLTAATLAVAAEAVAGLRRWGLAVELSLAVSGLGPRAARRWGRALGVERTLLQGRGSLGLRMQRQRIRAARQGARRLVLIGTDLPGLEATALMQAFQQLADAPLVLGPATDGGYWLIGLGGSWPILFAGATAPLAWGSAQVLAQTLEAADRLGLKAELLGPVADLDRPQDLEPWR